MAFREVTVVTEICEVLRAWLSGSGPRKVAEAVRPVRPGGHGRPWERLEACQAETVLRVLTICVYAF